MESWGILLNIIPQAAIRWTLSGPMCIMGGLRGRGLPDSLPIGQAVDGGWERFWQSGANWLVVWITVLAVLAAITWCVIEKIRPKSVQKERKDSQLLSKFLYLHSKGELSDEEFRTIKTNLAPQSQDELKGNGEKG